VILFYAAQTNPIVEMLEKQLAGYKVARCRTFDTMKKRLRKPRHGLEIALVVVENIQEIASMAEIQGLVRDLRLVLVLPERNPHMVSQAHKLAPRFIAYADLGPEQIVAVLKKMTGPRRRRHVVSAAAVADY
jgi:hypothetical protein